MTARILTDLNGTVDASRVGSMDGVPVMGLIWLLVIVLVASGVLVVVVGSWRRSLTGGESGIWPLLLVATGLAAGSAVIAGGVDLAGGDLSRAGDLIFGSGCVLACGFLFQGLVHWDGSRILTSDPDETLNGLSAALVAAAMSNLAVSAAWTATFSGIAQWQLQVALIGCGSMVVVVGTAVSVMIIGGLARDPRIWMLLAGIVVVLGAQVAAVPLGDRGRLATEPAWLLLGVLIIACRWVSPRIARPRPPNNQGTIVGALVVLIGGVAVLTVDDRLDAKGSLLTVVYALLGVLGASVRVVRLVQDFAHLAQTRLEARTDELTGLANRRALLATMDQALASSRRTGLLIIDLDRFKEINDQFGHASGDLLLKHVGAAFAQAVPPSALLARHGGDEFAVLLLDEAVGDAVQIARSLAAALTPLGDGLGRTLQVGASVGVALADEEDPRADGSELLRRADAAMYLAKTSGTGVRLYDSELDAAARERRELIEDLHAALEGVPLDHEQIIVFFQPQVRLDTGQVCGAEALVRWQHPRRGLLAPDTFLDLAEENGLMSALTGEVMRQSAVQARRWHEAGFELRVSVNLSATCLAEPGLLALIDEVLLDGIEPRHLVLEVTETSLMKDPDRALQAMRQIAERGVGVSIDDYGTGYSSLSYMNDLPATELKIDRSFTCRTVSDPRTAAIVAGTVELAHRLGMRLVVEGIEDVATLEVMAQLGCDESQGYLHSRPLPAEAFLLWLRGHRPEHPLASGPPHWASAR